MTYIEVRCSKCNKLLLKEDIILGTIEVKCHTCNTFNYYKVDKLDRSMTQMDNPIKLNRRF